MVVVQKTARMKPSIFLSLLFFASQLIIGQARAKKIDSISQAIHKNHPEVGISIGFLDNNKEYFFHYGNRDRENKLELNKHTLYEIGSISKLLTANLIAQAQDEGKLKVEDLIGEHLPTEYPLPEKIKNTVKISDLASHQSGLPNFNFEKLIEKKSKTTFGY